ncbi:MAG TPA: helix-turn-helix domain-containing protein [Terriglobia bacterium]|nr:helix-turn-helix domain-containing protein [Terriglobia bacterium]
MGKAKQRASASPERELPTDPEALLTKAEVAQVLGVTPRWVGRAIALRYFPSHRVGKLVRVRLKDLDAYLENRRVEAQ